MCGEHRLGAGSSGGRLGSSPRVRGTHSCPELSAPPAGIIPACAGNTVFQRFSTFLHGDHPRVCGEHMTGFAQGLNNGGSSPRVRGTRFSNVFPLFCMGIIPACAGNTGKQGYRLGRRRDHPRVCGEHRHARLRRARDAGSSPRVRGTHMRNCGTRRVSGIIPACAGNTQPFVIVWACMGDHPRVCGEHRDGKKLTLQRAGSSPRVRGTLQRRA